jgi:hypothetical protein
MAYSFTSCPMRALVHSAFGLLDSIEMVTGTRAVATQQSSDARFEMVVQEAC